LKDGLPIQIQQHGGGDRHARGGVGAGSQEGLLAGHISRAQDHHGFRAVPVIPADLHATFGDDRGAQARFALREQAGSGGNIPALGGPGDETQIRIGQPREDFAVTKN